MNFLGKSIQIPTFVKCSFSVPPKGKVVEPFDLAACILTLADSAC